MNIYMANKEHGGVGREDRDTERDLLKYNCTLKQRDVETPVIAKL